MNQIIPIIVIVITLLGGSVAYFFLKKNKKKSSQEVSREQQTANEMINVKDIKDKYLYTRDNLIMMYMKIKHIPW